MQTDETLARAANLPPNATDFEPAAISYADTVEGKLQYLADLSLYFSAQAKIAKTQFKRDFYKKKQIKNNQKLYNLLVRTPNSYNPLMKYLQAPAPTVDGETSAGLAQTEEASTDIETVTSTEAQQ